MFLFNKKTKHVQHKDITQGYAYF